MREVDPSIGHEGSLTTRQCDILVEMARGMTNSKIAEKLFLSPRSVEREIAKARESLNARNREVLLVHAYRLGVVSDEHLDTCSDCPGKN